MTFRFLHPWLLMLLAAVPLLAILAAHIQKTGRARIVFSDLSGFKNIPPSKRTRRRHLVTLLRALAMSALVVAIARPQYGNKMREIASKGIDIMIVLDHSSSMNKTDMTPNRLGAAKTVIDAFIKGRQEASAADRIGLVSFSRVSFTRCPLTVDYTILRQIVNRLGFTQEEFDGTAIGTALATAVGRLRNSKAKSKVIILVTDGKNNSGIDPIKAAALALSYEIRVYTIGVVPKGLMTELTDAIFGAHYVPSASNVEEDALMEIAQKTGGRYFKAEDEEGLGRIFEEIDQLEKTEVKITEYYNYQEGFYAWILAALGLVVLETVLAGTVFRKIP